MVIGYWAEEPEYGHITVWVVAQAKNKILAISGPIRRFDGPLYESELIAIEGIEGHEHWRLNPPDAEWLEKFADTKRNWMPLGNGKKKWSGYKDWLNVEP